MSWHLRVLGGLSFTKYFSASFLDGTAILFRGDRRAALEFKHSGFLDKVSSRVRGEYQVVSMLVGLFWEVEHSAIYKPTPELRGATRSLTMQERTQEVLRSLAAFEEGFEMVRNEARKKKKRKKKG